MKNFFSLTLFLFFGFASVQAQQSQENYSIEKQKQKVESLAQQLEMTPTQKRDVSKTILSFEKSMHALSKTDLPDVEKTAERRKISFQRDLNIEKYLTAQQYAEYLKLQKYY